MSIRSFAFKLCILALTLWALEARARAATVHVDASELSSPTVEVDGAGAYRVNKVADLNLSPGRWTINVLSYATAGGRWNAADFVVATDGTLAYDPSLEGVLSGAGTRSLTIHGAAVTIDDRLSSPHQTLGDIPMPATPVFTLHLFPGTYMVGMLSYTAARGFFYNAADFSVNVDGTLSYAAAASSYLAGAGTSALTVTGLPLHVHTALVGYSHRVYELSDPGGTDYDLAVLPGDYDYSVFTITPSGYSSNDFIFSVGAAGLVAYDPALEPFVHGAGTSTLDIEGFTVHVQSSIIGYSHGVALFQGQSSSGPTSLDVPLIPGDYEYCVSTYYFGYVQNCFPFKVTSQGAVTYDPALGGFVRGAGTSTLDVEGYAIHVDSAIVGYAHGISEIAGQSSGDPSGLDVRLVPGNYQYFAATYHNGYDANTFYFAINPDGTVQYDSTVAAFATGADTSTLHVSGFPIHFDMRALPHATTFTIDEYATLPVASIGTLALLPGNYHFFGGPLDFNFVVNATGAITYPASLEGTLFGNGTAQMSYGHAGCTSSADCAAGDVCAGGACAHDATPPSVAIDPLPAVTNQASLGVHATVSDDGALGLATVLRNGVTVASVAVDASGGVDATVPLVEGANTITVVATDAAGNTAGSSVTIALDTQAPAISITSPTDGQSLGAPDVVVTVAIVEPLATTVTIGSTLVVVPAGGGLATAQVSLASSGWSTIAISAVDAAGNASSSQARVFVDLNAPAIALDVADGATLGPIPGGSLPIHLSVADVGATQMTFSFGASASLPRGGGVVSTVVPLHEGTSTFSVTVQNEGGHSATLTRTVRYDTTPPSLSLVSPSSGGFARGTVELSADATDATSGVASVSFSIDGGAALAGSANLGAYTLALDTSLLADGAHQLKITATDGVGNVASSVSTLTVDNTAPTVAVTSPATGAYLRGTLQITASATDATSGVAALTLAVNGRAVATCASSPCSASLDTTSLPDGTFQITATATDAAGNEATPAAVSATAVNEAIGSFLLSPLAGAIVTTSLHVATEVTDPYFRSVECFVGGATLGVSTSARFSQDLSLLQTLDGALDVRCNAQDLAGNVGTQSATVTVKNWTETFYPHTLRLKSEGERVTMAVRGVNASILVPIGPRNLAISVPGGAPVPAYLGRAHGRDDNGDCDDHTPKHVDLKFDRKAFVASVRAGIAAGAINVARPVQVSLTAGSKVVGGDAIQINP